MQRTSDPIKKLRFLKETVLLRQGDSGPQIYFIHAGYVLIQKVDYCGNLAIIDLYGPGSWFGPGLTGKNLDIQATAKSGSELEVTSIQHLNAMMERQSQTHDGLLQQLATRESQLQQRLFLHITAPLPVRLANLLAQLFNYRGQPCGHGHQLDIKLTQSELAAMAGGSRQTVSQQLKQWKSDGVIDYTRQYICLLDQTVLKGLAENQIYAPVSAS
ncbi:Crp/Fnr family transcriptional regulator [Microbulbifer sp. ZKSA004]|uniref:Crp/Fnr family transcriptional regulator n=1 Tax=Microbulbifer sp. ZKSA004 TaxID=3243389 RepID=UPI00403907BB